MFRKPTDFQMKRFQVKRTSDDVVSSAVGDNLNNICQRVTLRSRKLYMLQVVHFQEGLRRPHNLVHLFEWHNRNIHR